MAYLLIWIGRLAGCLGVLVFAFALGARVAGHWTLGAVQIGTLFQLGVGTMVLGCLAYCAELAERPRK